MRMKFCERTRGFVMASLALAAILVIGCGESEEQKNADKMVKSLSQQRGNLQQQQEAQRNGKIDVGPGVNVGGSSSSSDSGGGAR